MCSSGEAVGSDHGFQKSCLAICTMASIYVEVQLL